MFVRPGHLTTPLLANKLVECHLPSEFYLLRTLFTNSIYDPISGIGSVPVCFFEGISNTCQFTIGDDDPFTSIILFQ
jgi:hypothetical protein